MKQRLLFISRKWPPAIGGMETYSVSLAESLRAHFDVELLVLPGREGGRPPGLLAYGMFLIRAMFHIVTRGRRYQHLVLGDLILFPAGLLSRLVAPWQSRSVVLYGLDLVYQRRDGLLPTLYGGFLSVFVACQRVFTTKVAISMHTCRLAKEAGLSDVSVVVPCLPDSALTRACPDTSLLPAAFTSATFRILYFGRLVPRKGAVWFAREVMPLLPAAATFFVVGAATEAEYQQQLLNLPRVHCLGRQPDDVLASLISHADIVVMPNIPSPDSGDAEGFGLVALEASSLGAVLVAARLQGITDAVVDGATGVLVEPADAPAWAATVSRLLREDHEQKQTRRERARAACAETYSLQRLGSDFAALIQQLPTTKGNSDER